jgi:hypothetical protein
MRARPDDRWWRDHLADAFDAIVKREGVTRRHVVMKRILERWPGAGVLVALAATKPSRPARSSRQKA